VPHFWPVLPEVGTSFAPFHERCHSEPAQSGGQEKLKTAEDLYRFMVDQFNQSRAFVLELMVVVILIIELVYFFRGKPI
jgi:hypothetical protein